MVILLGKIKKLKNGNEYVFPITISDAVFVDEVTSLKEYMKKQGGIGSYVLELKRWGVVNDSTDYTDKAIATNNSMGLNNALIWADAQGYKEFILPEGVYLIDETMPIEPKSFMTLNLGGSILRIRDNGLQGYHIIEFSKDQNFSRITNGKIQGDRYNHDYTSIGTHEHGIGVHVAGGSKFISIDNLEILDTTGDACTTGSSYGQIPGFYITNSTFEHGGINPSTGALEVNSTRIRFKDPISLDFELIKDNNYLGLYGDGYGGLGSDIISPAYDIAFYRSDNTLIRYYSSVEFYDDVNIPKNASYARISLYQSTLPNSVSITLRSPKYPYQTFIEKCNIHHCRRQGLSLQGKFIYVRDNQIHHIDGTPPQGGIDIEDGYAGNQYIFIDNNFFYENNSYDIVIKAARNVRISRNKLSGALYGPTLSISTGSEQIIVSHNTISGDANFYGETIVSNNIFYQSRINAVSEDGIRDKEVIIDSCIFKNCQLNIRKIKKYIVMVSNCTFINNIGKSKYTAATVNFNSEPQTITNCTFKGDSNDNGIFQVFSGAKNGWLLDSLVFSELTKAVTLPPGHISNCIFSNSPQIIIGTNETHEYFINFCKFNLAPYAWIHMALCKSVMFMNCSIVGEDGYVFRLYDIKELIIRDNVISYPISSNIFEFFRIEAAFKGNKILLDRNDFLSNSNKRLVEPLSTNLPSTQVIIKNNIFTNVNLGYKEFNPTVSMINNTIDGVIDPYFKLVAAPTNGFFKLAQEFKHSNPTPGGFIGWICTTAGYASNRPWSPSTNYTKGTIIYYNDHVYQAQNNGTTSSTSPTFPQTPGEAVIDNNITWKELGFRAVFKQYGSIQS